MQSLISWKWIVLWSLWLGRVLKQPTVPIKISSGLLQGYISPDGTYAEYLGVPYGAVKNRFQAPIPAPAWEGIFNANREHIRCFQRYTKSMISGQEDCLTLNIYTPLPRADDDTLRPVMVFIHGGGFRDGSGTPLLYGPEYLIPHDVILVTINYRLEVLGFLCLGIEEAPGNAGLKDQVEALKWVQKNIKNFSGDPDNVTLFGESAGSSSVVYHLISPMSEGLFHKAIMQSGSVTSPWAFQFEPLKTATKLAKEMGVSTEDPKEIHKVFMNKTPEELLSTRVPRTKGDVVLSENIFVPCVEKSIPGTKAFLKDLPYNLIAAGKYKKMPMIIGYNNAEGYMFVGKENETTIANFDFYNALPRDLKFPSKTEAMKTANKLKNLYLKDKEISKQTREELARFEGDAGITYSVLNTIEMMLTSNTNAIFTYKNCYSGWLNLAKMWFGIWGAPGATHADELFYMFKTRITLIFSFFETDMVRRISTMWTNFAKFGNPTPEQKLFLPRWPPTDQKNPRVLIIDKEFSTGPLWDDKILLFWNETYTKYRRKA